MLVPGRTEGPGHRYWDWIYFVAAGIAISAPSLALPFEYPVGYIIAVSAAIVVFFRGVWWGWRTGRIFVVLGSVGFLLNSIAIYDWFLFYQHIHRPRTIDERSRDQEKLHVIVRTLEYAKHLRGEYPPSLEDLKDWIPSVYFADLWDPTKVPGCGRIYPGYSRSQDGSRYELFGIGEDCTPGTDDDVYVNLPAEERAKVGLHNPQ